MVGPGGGGRATRELSENESWTYLQQKILWAAIDSCNYKEEHLIPKLFQRTYKGLDSTVT